MDDVSAIQPLRDQNGNNNFAALDKINSFLKFLLIAIIET